MMKKLLLTAMAIATTIGAIAQVEPPVGAIDGRFSVATDKQVYCISHKVTCNATIRTTLPRAHGLSPNINTTVSALPICKTRK